MSIRKHPSEATLFAYAAGTLPAGQTLAVGAHLYYCEDCKAPVRTWEMAAGAMLDSLPESEMASDALTRTLARAQSGEAARPSHAPNPNLSGAEIPAIVCRAGINKRRRIAPGIWTAVIPAGTGAKSQTYLLGLGPNRKIPLHGHSGPEMICVLKGSFSDSNGVYGEGDFVEIDEAADHQPAAGSEGECVCIIASEGAPRFRGLFGWLLERFSG